VQKVRHRIQFPEKSECHLSQADSTFFLLDAEGHRRTLRFHDYDQIYGIQGLYEQVFYDRLKCHSHSKISEILNVTLHQSQENFSELRVLDFGAGNGIMGEALKKHGVSRLVGVDIIPEAKRAAERDRPDIYDAYYVADFCALNEDDYEEFDSWSLNCLTIASALGFDDIPTQAFMTAYNIIEPKGWIALNIKESFLKKSDSTGFSRLMRELIFSEYLDLHHLERYRHRLSIEGKPLFYFVIVGRKNTDISLDTIEKFTGSYK
jgi:SAM-dependent methyltransferase